jgi:hypothetical protein
MTVYQQVLDMGGAADPQADARTRTGDPFITSEVLYQLSYVGAMAQSSGGSGPVRASARAGPRPCRRARRRGPR